MLLNQLSKPTLVIDKEKVHRNIHRMHEKIKDLGLEFRPHFKTHRLPQVGNWFKEQAITRIAASSVSMASYFQSAGFQDITIAFPVNVNEMDALDNLAGKIHLHVLVESEEVMDALNQSMKNGVGVFIKIDTGNRRTGVWWENFDTLQRIIDRAQQHRHHFKGFLVHAGNTYHADSVREIQAIHDENMQKLEELKEHFVLDFPNLIVSYGDTPTASLMEDFGIVDELRPGNFVYYDLMQKQLGACGFQDIAAAMYCPVVATHAERNEIVLYGGAVHFSKESLTGANNRKHYGLVAQRKAAGWGDPIPDAYVKALSQEHGIVKAPDELVREVHPGDWLAVLPVHSCLLMPEDHYIINE